MLSDNKLKLILTLYKEDKITFEQFKELITDLPIERKSPYPTTGTVTIPYENAINPFTYTKVTL